jgi:hypothetical protein
MVAWRRGHRVSRRGKLTKEQKDALPLISNATVNRSTIAVLRRLFSFAKDEGARFAAEPKWEELLLPEPEERVRELQEDESQRSITPYGPITSPSSSSSGPAACGRRSALC